MGKVSILFGAGADQPYGIGAGETFIEPLLTDRYKDGCKKLLGFKKPYALLHPLSKNIYLQTIAEHQKEAESCFAKADVTLYVDYYLKRKELIKCKQERVEQKCKEWYDLLTKSEKSDQDKDFFLKNAIFFDTLDEKFNSLRLDNINEKGKRVMTAYATIFIYMLSELYELDTDFEYEYGNIFEKLLKSYDKIKNVKPEESYYKILGKFPPDVYRIFTTNYTSIVENELPSTASVTYLHGRMDWFEDMRNLTVYDIKNEEERKEALKNKDNLIPFLMIPSGVKPMICTKQINQMAQFINGLDLSKWLIVVGYRFNSEDNHLNAIIGEWIASDNDRKLIYLNYENSVDFETLKWVSGRFSIKKQIFPDLDIDVSEQIIDISVDRGNSSSAFEKLCSMLMRRG